jgi:FKBP-type peptidyl-prolyl cis-trans isomerase FklB
MPLPSVPMRANAACGSGYRHNDCSLNGELTMLRASLLLVLALAPRVHAEEPAVDSTAHDLSYSVGASLGGRLREEIPALELPALIEGLQHAYQGQSLALSNERIEQILSEHDAQLDAERQQAQASKALEIEQRLFAEEKARPGSREIDQGIVITELTAGNGAKPQATSRVQVRYLGRLPDGSVFDDNRQPQWFSLGSVITGWRIALQQMPVGAKWRVAIPAVLAYGAEGAGDLIPADTPLVFEIELLAIAP